MPKTMPDVDANMKSPVAGRSRIAQMLVLWVAAWLLIAGTAYNVCSQTSNLLQRPASYGVEVWDTDRGLPQSFVFAMTQSREGYLWLATYAGLVRFDGIRFSVLDENNTPGLNSSRIVSLFEDAQTNLWFGTDGAGIARLNNGQISESQLGKGKLPGRVEGISADSNGVVWAYSRDGYLWRYAKGESSSYPVGRWSGLVVEPSGVIWLWKEGGQVALSVSSNSSVPIIEQNLPATKLSFVLGSREGGFWRISDGHIQKWKDKKIQRDLGVSEYPWSDARVRAACEDLEGNLVVGTEGAGVYWFNAEGKATCISTNNGLSSSYILSLAMDREGNLWVGTDGGGLNRVKRHLFDLLPETKGLVVQSVCPDTNNGLWIGFNLVDTRANAIAYLKDGELQSIRCEVPNTSVKSLYADRQGRVWAGMSYGLYQLQNDRFVPVTGLNIGLNPVSAIYQDREGRLWVGTGIGLACLDAQGWKIFTKRDGMTADSVQAIAEDKAGNLWIGTIGGGLNRFRDGQFTAFRKSKEGLPSDDISSLWIDADDVIWVGTAASGLARFAQGKWTRYGTREGLVSNGIGYMIEDEEGFLWIGSNMGLMRVEKSALNNVARGANEVVPCRTYSRADGLPTAQCPPGGNQPGACRTADGKFWFPTIKGLVSVNPKQLHRNPYPPSVVIESVFVDDKKQNTNGLSAGQLKRIVVPARRERLAIQFTSLSLTAPEKARFSYRLEPHESLPNIVDGNTREVRYPKLPPNTYYFRVNACNEDGVWNPTGSTLEIVVLPPFWRTWWFLTACSLAFLGSIVAIVHYVSTQRLQREVQQLHQQEVLQGERSRIARDLHDQLGASLTQVALLGELVESDKENPKEVEGHAQQISQTARETTRVLDEIVWAVNPSNDTLEGLVNYICKYAQEYLAVAGVRYRLDVPSEMPATPLPPEVRHNVFLAAKEAVTNVVRHAKAASAKIHIALEPTRFTVEIQDDGKGLGGLDPKAAAKRNGLKNMRKRMEDIGGEFSMTPAPERGAVVRLSAPLTGHTFKKS